jgi:hypothetical protein
VSIHGTHLAQTLQCSNFASIVSNALNFTFSSTKLDGHTPLICAAEQIEALTISCADSCAGLP